MSLDSTEDPVSRDWLGTILSNYYKTEVRVVDFTSGPGCDSTESVLSDVLAVTAELVLSRQGKEESLTLHLVLKLLPIDPFSRFFVAEAQFDLREVKFYTQIVPQLEAFQASHLTPSDPPILLPIPICYFAKHVPVSHDTESSPSTPTIKVDESVIVLENLKERGFHAISFAEGLTLEQAESALEAVSNLHALSLAIKVKEKKSLFVRYPFLFQVEQASSSYEQLVNRGLPRLSRFLKARNDMDLILKQLEELRSCSKELIEALLAPEDPMALITHTDFWCNNLLFKDNECIILDWQMVTCSQPTNDIALLLVSSLSAPTRRSSTPHLLDHYWHHLTTRCRRLNLDIESDLGYNLARLSADYRRSQLLAILLCIGSVDVALGDPVTEQRMVDALLDLSKDGVLSPDIVRTGQLKV